MIEHFHKLLDRLEESGYEVDSESLEDSPRIDLEIKALPNKLEEALKTGVDVLKAIKVI